MKLTEHFQLSEFTRSKTASERGIDNTLNPANPQHQEIISNLTQLCNEILEPLREYAGKPILIGSGYRCPMLNKAVGGVTNSQHMTGEAVDIHLYSIEEGKQWLTWIINNSTFDQLLWERESRTSCSFWIHVSCRKDRSKNRHQVRSIIKNP